jgi:uncharacterized protein
MIAAHLLGPGALVLVALAATPAFAQGPSYDCAKAQTPDEKAICADAKLSELDRLGAQGYRQARSSPGNAKKSVDAAKAFLAKRRACDATTDCIMREQAAVLEVYRGLGATVEVPEWAKTPPDWAGADPNAKVKSVDSAGPNPAQVAASAAQAAKPAAPPEPAKWSGPCRVEQAIGGGTWIVRVEESFATIRAQMVYSALDVLRLKTRDGGEARAKVFPYTYSASVTPSGKPDAVQTEWQYEQIFVSVDPGGADLDPAASVDVRIGRSTRPLVPGTPTTLDPSIAEEIGREVTEIGLSAGEHALAYPLDRAVFDAARQRMRALVDEVAAKALGGKCFG